MSVLVSTFLFSADSAQAEGGLPSGAYGYDVSWPQCGGALPPVGSFDFAIVDIEVDEKGSGSGTLAPAATIAVKQGAFVVGDYGSEAIRLTGVKKVK